ncbi:phosphoglycerate kinase [Patescibacteria group bacterium]
MSLPSVKNVEVKAKKVLLRTNYDVPITADGRVADGTRIYESFETIKYLLSQKAKLIIISHLDRPGGKVVPGLSLSAVVERMRMKIAGVKIGFSGEILGEKTKRMVSDLKSGELLVLENLRFDNAEMDNDPEFSKSLASLAQVFINDAFAVSHRQHASIVGLPSLLPTAFGLDFLEEVEVLSRVKDHPQRPVVLVLGGRKKGKLVAINKLLEWADSILVGGKLVEYPEFRKFLSSKKISASLTKAGEDITMETVASFRKIIVKAKTIVWSGPMGAFEDERFQRGTEKVAQMIAGTKAFKVVGGGDTEAALTKLNLKEEVDYISSGGSAMLAYLANKTLPGIEAVVKKPKTKN